MILQAFRDRLIMLLMVPCLLANIGMPSIVFWVPTFIKRLSGLPDSRVSLLVMLPAMVGLFGLIFNGWHSDKTGERRWHTAVPLACVGTAYLLLMRTGAAFRISIALFAFG